MSKSNNSYKFVVLVVEDELLIRDCIVSYLKEAGCLVLEAASGERAIEMLVTDRPIDVVFTDIRLGGFLNGWDVGEACRTKWNDIAVIYASGHSIAPARSVPGSLFINKPYSFEQVFEACQSLCNPARH
jgi:two-component system OmpR family response regulator